MQNRKAQSLIEHSTLIAVLVAALVGMFIYLRFSLQGRIRETADVFGRGEQYELNVTTVTTPP
jgi:hypothetical protein